MSYSRVLRRVVIGIVVLAGLLLLFLILSTQAATRIVAPI